MGNLKLSFEAIPCLNIRFFYWGDDNSIASQSWYNRTKQYIDLKHIPANIPTEQIYLEWEKGQKKTVRDEDLITDTEDLLDKYFFGKNILSGEINFSPLLNYFTKYGIFFGYSKFSLTQAGLVDIFYHLEALSLIVSFLRVDYNLEGTISFVYDAIKDAVKNYKKSNPKSGKVFYLAHRTNGFDVEGVSPDETSNQLSFRIRCTPEFLSALKFDKEDIGTEDFMPDIVLKKLQESALDSIMIYISKRDPHFTIELENGQWIWNLTTNSPTIYYLLNKKFRVSNINSNDNTILTTQQFPVVKKKSIRKQYDDAYRVKPYPGFANFLRGRLRCGIITPEFYNETMKKAKQLLKKELEKEIEEQRDYSLQDLKDLFLKKEGD